MRRGILSLIRGRFCIPLPMRVRFWLLIFPIFALTGCDDPSAKPAESVEESAKPSSPSAPQKSPGPLAKSSECLACHKDSFEAWQGSHHQLAHRDTGGTLDLEPFADISLTVGHAQWKFTGGAEDPRIEWSDTLDPEAGPITGQPPMAIGLDPLVQYLLDTGDGRYQVPDLAWDPAKKEWFSIYGDQDRRPQEWGHWTQRGMNWNSQCAYCHFTGYKKNHDSETDGYKGEWIEQGVGCAQCHGPSRPNHGKDECIIDPAKKYTREQWMHSCATCHARREEFDEEFVIGDSFYDHYSLALPNQPGLWFPDGQQLDEIYKFSSIMMSKMGHKGVTCLDCHDPHEAAPLGGEIAVRSNALCMTCHAGGLNGATVINPAQHTFHDPGTKGASCVDCHMPKRNYMGRDPRSDHRFPIPDPLLTKELGTPNACNDCHEDKGLDWQIEWTDKWYGDKMKRPERERTRAIHAAQTGKTGALDMLLDSYDIEEIDAWKATLLRLMDPWNSDSRVVKRTNNAAQDGGPLARAAAAMLIGQRGDNGPLLEKVLSDPLKAVRLEAAWAAFERIPNDHPVIEETRKVAEHQSDQPGGAMRMARLNMKLGQMKEAEKWFKRAAAWDQTSPAPRRDFAVFLSSVGRTQESVKWLDDAAELAPDNAEIPYLAALAYAELGEPAKAESRLRTAVQIAPGFSRAYYNLGLLQNSQGKPQDAIASLQQAADTDPTNPEAPYAQATILIRLGQVEQAIAAARESLRRAPDYQPAQGFLRQLGQ